MAPIGHRIAATKRRKVARGMRRCAEEEDGSRERKRGKGKEMKLEMMGYHYYSDIDYSKHSKVDIGNMDIVCEYCRAMKFRGETKGMCCNNGKVKLPNVDNPPEPLNSYLYGNTVISKHFLKNVRGYNSCFQMTSFGASCIVNGERFMPTFKVQGQIYHMAGSFLPTEEENPKFLQVYFMGNEDVEVQERCKNVTGLKEEVIRNLQKKIA